MHFVLIGNYPPDGQESMLRFADLLARGLKSRGASVEIIAPQPVLVTGPSNPGSGWRKWLAYADKWVLFPPALRRIVRDRDRQFGGDVQYHICDHSNAPYLKQLPKDRSAITCHDVLAIRGALGYPDSYCAASRTGIILQRWILKHLSAAPRVACVSRLTLRHLCEVTGRSSPQPGWTVIPNALNATFEKMERAEAIRVLNQHGISIPQPFLLHVGSNLPRKNRRMLLQMAAHSPDAWHGAICFAGEAPDAELQAEARRLGWHDKVHAVPKPDHETLCALYSLADAFVFPSLSEGFGWPLIEAQACGLPVIASDIEPLPEVTGCAALHVNPRDAGAFAAALKQLNDPATRESLVEAGLKNAARFDLPAMTVSYLALHEAAGTEVAPAVCHAV
jgi:glycosyltransferase involved in cell wall biosynthesis